LYTKLPYDPIRDFTPIARGVTALNMLVVHPSFPVSSVKELIAYAKANPARLNFGSSGAGRADHLAGEMFNALAGVKMQHVPYKGGAPAIVDLVGGNIQLIFATVSTAITSVKSGRILRSRSRPPIASTCFPICRPWQKPACRASPSITGTGSSGRAGCRGTS
jgi:tripartite-type tricarboxylate transporter receptor subunit TctC